MFEYSVEYNWDQYKWLNLMCFFAQYRKLIIYLKEFACFIFRSNKIRISTKRLIFEIYIFYNKGIFLFIWTNLHVSKFGWIKLWSLQICMCLKSVEYARIFFYLILKAWLESLYETCNWYRVMLYKCRFVFLKCYE